MQEAPEPPARGGRVPLLPQRPPRAPLRHRHRRQRNLGLFVVGVLSALVRAGEQRERCRTAVMPRGEAGEAGAADAAGGDGGARRCGPPRPRGGEGGGAHRGEEDEEGQLLDEAAAGELVQEGRVLAGALQGARGEELCAAQVRAAVLNSGAGRGERRTTCSERREVLVVCCSNLPTLYIAGFPDTFSVVLCFLWSVPVGARLLEGQPNGLSSFVQITEEITCTRLDSSVCFPVMIKPVDVFCYVY